MGRNGGSNAELEKAKAEALKLQNRLTLLKVQKLEGELVEKVKIKFLIGDACTTLRTQLLELPSSWSPSFDARISSPHNFTKFG